MFEVTAKRFKLNINELFHMLHLDVSCIFVSHVNLFVQVFMKDVIHASPQTPLYTRASNKPSQITIMEKAHTTFSLLKAPKTLFRHCAKLAKTHSK